MIAVVSPAKLLNESPMERRVPSTSIALGDDVEKLAVTTRRLTAPKIQKLMGVSDELAKRNRDRFQRVEFPFTEANAKPAAFLFNGDTYRGLDANSLDDADLAWAQDHLRILSGFYGVVRPLDLIQPYRLEMGTALRTRRGPSLYRFWGDRITGAINDALEGHADRTVVHLASAEYFKAVRTDKLDGPVLTCSFREERDGELRFISFSAKQARGMMARYMIRNRIDTAEDLKHFSAGDYSFRPELSSDTEWMFVRPDQRPRA